MSGVDRLEFYFIYILLYAIEFIWVFIGLGQIVDAGFYNESTSKNNSIN